MRFPPVAWLLPLALGGCVGVSVSRTGADNAAAARNDAADSTAAFALFRDNIDAIHKRDRARYLAGYIHSPRLVRNGPQGPEFGYEDWSARRESTWPDTLIATDLRVVPVSPGVVYGTYRYDVRYGDSTSTGVSERVFVKTPDGWRIAVTSAFGTPLRYSPRQNQ